MDEKQRQALLEKNRKLTDMVIERAKRDFPDDTNIQINSRQGKKEVIE